ncbi:LPP20 family lipoprotein [Candidatus Cloacimonadota bacterium]
MLKKYLILLLLILVVIPLAAKKKPNWVKERPIENEYYIGIGVSQKVKGSNDHIQLAKDDALKNLASEIEIKISSEVVSSVIEKSGIVEDELRAKIVSTTKAELEDYKLVDTWENKKEYWVYYRLARDTYELNRRKKIDTAKSLALDLYVKAEESKNDNEYTKALNYYLQALKPIEPYFTESLVIENDGKELHLNNEIYTSLHEIVSGIELKAIKSPVSAKIGKALKGDSGFMAQYLLNESIWLIRDLPLKFEFIKGAGELVETGRTDEKGISRLIISKMDSPEKMQIVKTYLDINSLIETDSTSYLFNNIISTLPIPEAKIIINVSGLSILIETIELNLGEEETIKHAEPLLKEKLAELGYSFTEDMTDADLYIKLDVATTEGSYLYKMYSVFADANISVTDMNSGEEIYKTSLSKVKGIDLDQIKASRKALNKVGKELAEEIVPKLKKKF